MQTNNAEKAVKITVTNTKASDAVISRAAAVVLINIFIPCLVPVFHRLQKNHESVKNARGKSWETLSPFP